MKMSELDCEGGCPFREEGLCNMGPPCFYDPPCSMYGNDDRDVEDIIDEIWACRAAEEDRQDRLEKQRQEKEAKNKEAGRKRREANWATFEERMAIRSLQKRIQRYEAAIRFASSMRELNSMFGGGIKEEAITPESEQQIRNEIAACIAEIAVLEQRKKEKLKALRRQRALRGSS